MISLGGFYHTKKPFDMIVFSSVECVVDIGGGESSPQEKFWFK